MTISSIKKLLSKDLKKLDVNLKNRSKTQVSMINDLSSHIITSGGKRLRPILLFLSAYSSSDKETKDLIDAAVVVEFIHAATLLHDDVVDMSKIRHSRDTANMIWGNEGAVLVGDFLYSRAFEIIVEINNSKVYETLAKTTNIISQGEVMQLMNKGNLDVNESEYMDIIYRKTAILFQASARIGATIAGGNDITVDALSSFGLHFGNAYQLRNDYLDYFGQSDITGKNIVEDLLEGKATLPIIHAISQSNDEDAKSIRNAFSKSNVDEDSVIKILEKYSSNLYIKQKIEEQTNLAISALKPLRPGLYKDNLVNLANFCKNRVS